MIFRVNFNLNKMSNYNNNDINNNDDNNNCNNDDDNKNIKSESKGIK